MKNINKKYKDFLTWKKRVNTHIQNFNNGMYDNHVTITKVQEEQIQMVMDIATYADQLELLKAEIEELKKNG